MLGRLLAAGLLLLLATQQVAPSAVRVCRFTGKAMRQPCPCAHDAAPGAARVERESCCELRSSEGARHAAVPPQGLEPVPCTQVTLAWATLPARPVVVLKDAGRLGPAPPDERWRYLALEQLLL